LFFAMTKTVHIIAMCVKVPEEMIGAGDEVWGVNRSYQQQPNLTRLFFFDHPFRFKYPPILKDLAKTEFQVWTRKAYPEIGNNRVYPREEVVNFLGKIEYFTCTVAWMMGLAIYEGFERIYLRGMYLPYDSIEYMHHVPCVNFWAGVALGRGINVIIGNECGLAKPFPWQPGLYGYTCQENERLQIRTIAAAHQACANYPVSWLDAEESERQELERIRRTQEAAFAAMTDEDLKLIGGDFGFDTGLSAEEIRDLLVASYWDPHVNKGTYTSSDRIGAEVDRFNRERNDWQAVVVRPRPKEIQCVT
jgi:hypothetical protein